MDDSFEKTKLKELTENLNPRQKLFCEYFVSDEFFGNGVKSYLAAYKEEGDELQYNSAKVLASNLLTNININAYISYLIDVSGLNDHNVDKQLLIVINQNSEYCSKVAGIREYNRLKQRITDKLKHEGEVTIRSLTIESVDPLDESK